MTYTGTPDDLTATPEPGHIIRVKELSVGLWRWSVTVGDITVDCRQGGKQVIQRTRPKEGRGLRIGRF